MIASSLGPHMRLRPALRPVCGAAIRWQAAAVSPLRRSQRHSSSQSKQIDPAAVLSQPTWSVRSLLPDSQDTPLSTDARITPKQLHHLLRLSALPLPKSPEEETEMINVLQSQLSFVRDIQSVNTIGVEPIRSIRDETDEGFSEATIGVEQLQQALSDEGVFGRRRRPRRQKSAQSVGPQAEDWDPLHTASQTSGRFFVVRSGKAKNE
jgi:hypothetical protein